MRELTCLLFSMAASGLCLADDEKNWYMAFGTGASMYEGAGLSDSDCMESVAGGLYLNDYFSVEASYLDLGDVRDRVVPGDVVSISQDTLALDVKGYSVASVFHYPVSDALVLSARLGLSRLDADKEWTGGTWVNPVFENDTGGSEAKLYYGFQLEYKVVESWLLGLNWDHMEVGRVDVDGVYARLTHIF